MIAPSAKLVQHLVNNLPRNAKILDLGCGEGRNSLYLSQVGFNVVGLDLSFKAVSVMQNNFFEEKLKGSSITADARHLPIKNQSFDAILAHHLFDHLSYASTQKALDEAYRVLSPSGIMLMTLDTFQEVTETTPNDFESSNDGSIIFVKGNKKGMLIRPFKVADLNQLTEKGWLVLKNEETPNKSKILLLKKAPIQ